MLKQVQHDITMSRLPFKRHPELVSGSVRGEGQEKARSEMLKFAIKREQSQACLNYAEREQIEQR